jgi:archaellum component FlaC
MSPRIRSAYDLYLLKKLKSRGTVSKSAIGKFDEDIKELSERYSYLSHRLNTLDSSNYANDKSEIESEMGQVEEMLESVILTALEFLSCV